MPTFFQESRNELSAPFKKLRNDMLKQPLTPVKKAIINATFDYAIEVIEQRNVISLIGTNANERLASFSFICSQIQMSDDDFIGSVQKHVETIERSSLFRKKVIESLDQAQVELNSRRHNTQNLIAGVGALLLYANPGIVLSALGAATLLAYISNNLSPVSNEMLEFYDSTALMPAETANDRENPCNRLRTTYHKFSK